MSEKEIIEQLKKLPSEAQQEAADFVEFLRKKYLPKTEQQKSSGGSILDSTFKGAWKNRSDMKSSSQWVRNIRKSRWAE